MNDKQIDRREFLGSTGAALTLGPLLDHVTSGATQSVRIAFIGVGGRGTGLLKVLLKMAQAGAFGNTYYAECSSIDDCSRLRF